MLENRILGLGSGAFFQLHQLYLEIFGFNTFNCPQFGASNIMFLMAILTVAALQKEGQLQLYKFVNNKKS
jgi:hypothetical protein